MRNETFNTDKLAEIFHLEELEIVPFSEKVSKNHSMCQTTLG